MDVFIDESGYTGENFTSVEQPVLVIASTIADEALCDWLVNQCFSKCRARELKHSSLASRASGQAMIVRFVELVVREHRSAFATDFAHKLYALVGKLVDWWVEEAMHRCGVDLYERGANIALTNVTYCSLQALLGDEQFRQLLILFEQMVRAKSEAAYECFWHRVREIRGSVSPRFQDLIDYFLIAEDALGYRYLLELVERPLEIVVSLAAAHVNHWSTGMEEPLSILHDQSEPMSKERQLWDAFVTQEAPEVTVGYDRRTFSFPLNVAETKPVDSKAHRAIQLTDVLAGATAVACGALIDAGRRTEYSEALRKAGILETAIGCLWPSSEVTPEGLGTEGGKVGDPFELYSELLRRRGRPTG